MGAAPTSRSPLVLAVHRLVLRTGPTPLGRLWRLAYKGVARAVAAYLTWGARDAAAYARGGSGAGDLVPGLSDVDISVVFARPGRDVERARRRWDRLTRAFPATSLLVDGPMVYDEGELRELAGTSALTYDRGRAGYFGGHASFDWLRTLERPGLYGVSGDWRLLTGPDRRPPERAPDPQHRRIAGWLELLYLWRWAFSLCLDATGPRSAALCVQLVANPARIWLWLAHGERAPGREDALRRALRRLPDEEDALRRAIDLQRSLPHSPAPPLGEVLPALVRFSARIAALIGAEVGREDVTEVRLAGADSDELLLPGSGREPGALPLVDWRALACPLLPDEAFAVLPGDPGDPDAVAAAASAPAGPYPALCGEGVMVMPAAPWWRSRLRAVQCASSDPVSFALAAGDRVARFPEVPGWSAADTARRAVAEHRAWLRGERGPWSVQPSEGGGALAMLLTASRAALFLESIAEGEPELPLTVTETARRLAADEALERYREFVLEGRQPPTRTVSAMRRLVLGLPAYSVTPRQAVR